MRKLRLRFTIGSLMIAVAVAAALLALPIDEGVSVLVLAIPCLCADPSPDRTRRGGCRGGLLEAEPAAIVVARGKEGIPVGVVCGLADRRRDPDPQAQD